MPQMMKVMGLVMGLTLGCTALAGAWPAVPPQTPDRTRAFTVRVTGTGNRPMILIPGLFSSGEVWLRLDRLTIIYPGAHRYRIAPKVVAVPADTLSSISWTTLGR